LGRFHFQFVCEQTIKCSLRGDAYADLVTFVQNIAKLVTVRIDPTHIHAKPIHTVKVRMRLNKRGLKALKRAIEFNSKLVATRFHSRRETYSKAATMVTLQYVGGFDGWK
jgi:hypothetical protein